MGSLVTHTPVIMHLMILVSLAAATSAAPQIVPYQHVEIPAEPYIHEEVAAEPYVHIEPELTPEALGVIDRSNLRTAPVAPPQQFAGPVQGVWTGTCLNNLGEGVPCRQKF